MKKLLLSMFILAMFLNVGVSEKIQYSSSGLMQTTSSKGDFAT